MPVARNHIVAALGWGWVVSVVAGYLHQFTPLAGLIANVLWQR